LHPPEQGSKPFHDPRGEAVAGLTNQNEQQQQNNHNAAAEIARSGLESRLTAAGVIQGQGVNP